ncbi:phosphate/phosphite/phosphonate ABC transporter substrate-binding protein [Botrimarina hoheduenensis]|uniref:ABC transporter, phosphonate, periplasmic substrate-binding protein n=1 Tax=Botrimarina hoheduenensis TaxID=2528000 RepID=A0A5C5WEA9_9BACT|nr:phosphate/phosphite/phosphonate ABC transporter substrate-binding protein [Botrimarina hoheduenensis]TWT48483.1 ABC transporter, phosphonate, periplasmic substrate-binding protein [Botrimarina hoheduenensis]
MSDSPASAISLGRLLKVLLPVALVALVVNAMLPSYEKAAQQQLEADMLDRLLGPQITTLTEKFEMIDKDGDLVCDPPADDQCQDPERLVFSYIAGANPDAEGGPGAWVDLIAALSETTGKPVEYKTFEKLGDQLDAVVRGEVHIVGLSTGAASLAVAEAGVTPVCCPGNSDGSWGYTMKLLTPAKSPITQFAQLTGKKLGFVDPNSNSGFKAALVLLLKEGLQPERDYQWGFTGGHDTSIKDIVAGEHDAAPVASDLLARLVAEGQVSESDFNVLYESERFPPALIGYAHNLTPALREAIRETLLGFVWEGTTVGEQFAGTGAVKFVPITYKDDWANIRRIDYAVTEAKTTVSASPAAKTP